MEQCEVLSVNSQSRIEHLEVTAPSLNKAFLIFEEHLQKNRLPRPQILASAADAHATRLMLTGESEALDSLLRSLTDNATIRPIKKTLSSITLTCHGSVATDLATRVMSRLEQDGILVDKVLFTPLSISVCVSPAQREAAIRALHTLIEA